LHFQLQKVAQASVGLDRATNLAENWKIAVKNGNRV